MTTKFSPRALFLPLALAATLALPTAAQAHRAWLLPSGTVFSAQEPWVSVDAAVSNDIFYFDHVAGNLDALVVVAPDGKTVQAENAAKGRYRSVFDVKLSQPGTYRIAQVSDALMASYKVGSENKRARGSRAELAKSVPADASELRVTRVQNRVETFVTVGKPSTGSLKATGQGVELVAVTHPNDLVAGEEAVFRFLDNGKPAVGYRTTVILGGKRYRSELGEINVTTDAQGEVRIKWPAAGMYWLNVTPPRAAANAVAPAGTLHAPTQRSNYSLTLEVLPG